MPLDQPATSWTPRRLRSSRWTASLAGAKLLAGRRPVWRPRSYFDMFNTCIKSSSVLQTVISGRRGGRRPAAGSAARKSRRNPLKRLKTGSETRSPPLSAASPRGGPGLAPGRRRGPENPPQALEIAQNRLGFGPRASRSVVARRPTTRRSGGPGSPGVPLDRHAPFGLSRGRRGRRPVAAPGARPGSLRRPENSPQAFEIAQNRPGNGNRRPGAPKAPPRRPPPGKLAASG